MKNQTLILLLSVGVFFWHCSNDASKTTKHKNQNFEITLDDKAQESDQKTQKEEDVIFYNMFSPVDLNKVIEGKASFFNSAYINSLNNITRYTASQKIALNIGIYGADLTYLWMFEQNQQALSYLSAIQHLTSKLGIPDNFVELTVESVENNTGNLDTLVSIARDAYTVTDKYLKGSDREDAAILILLGGWIETLHISLNMYTQPDSKLASRIITQKYSLTSLINMVQNSQDDIVMSEYLLLMKKLNEEFQKLESKLKPEDIEIDTAIKQISIKNTSNIVIQPEELATLKSLTSNIRKHIIQ